jgi:IS5 family transposase
MALGVAPVEQRFENPRVLLGDRLKGVYRFLADHGERLFPHEYFADLYTDSRRGRPTVPARVLATVMVLQAHEGLSDREACDRLERDLAWQAAAGVDAGAEAFHPTVLVGQRNRLRASERPKRFLEDTRVAAKEAGVLGRRVRVLDSTPVYDAVATQDTVTQLRAAIRKLLRVLEGSALAVRVRMALTRDDDYAGPGKPPCDWDDPVAREALVDALVRDALAALGALDGRRLRGAAAEAAELLALIAGQDVELGDDGVFRVARRVAADRVISTVDPEARHGHKSRNRRFDGYKAHYSVDPDSELVDDVTVTPANCPDGDPEVVEDLLEPVTDEDDKPEVMGDSAYSGGDLRDRLAHNGFDVRAKVPPATNKDGRYSKNDFDIDLEARTVSCPGGVTVPIRLRGDGRGGTAQFGAHCGTCALREGCTTNSRGRQITLGPHEALLQQARAEQATEAWQAAYRSTRPKVERKIAHLMRVGHGGRKARCRGLLRVTTDAVTRAAAVNLARLATLGLTHNGAGWAIG